MLFDKLYKEHRPRKPIEQCFKEKEIEQIKKYCTFAPKLISKNRRNLHKSDINKTDEHKKYTKRTLSSRGRERSNSLYQGALRMA